MEPNNPGINNIISSSFFLQNMASKTCLLFGLCFLFSAIFLPTIQSKNNNPFQFLQSLENVQKIDHNYTGIKDLKKYLKRFGYLKNYDDNVPVGLEDAHDNENFLDIYLIHI